MAEENTIIRTYKYTITQTAKGARITVHGDAIEETIDDYAKLRVRLEQEGFKVASEE